MINSLKLFFARHKTEVLLFVAAFLAQMAIFAMVIKFGTGRFLWSSDAEAYFTLAKNLLSHGGFFIRPEWGPSAYRTPLYPMFVAGLYWLIPQLWFVVLIQNILGAFSVVLVYILAKNIFGHKTALLSAILFLFESQRLHVTNQLMSEALFMVLFLPALYFYFLYRTGGDKRCIILSGLLLGISTLVRPVTQYLPLIMIAFIFFKRPFWKNAKANIGGAALFAVVFLAAVAPWSIRNKIHFNNWKLSPLQGINLYYTDAVHFLEYRSKAEGTEKEFYKELTEKAEKDLGLTLDRSRWTEETIRLMEFAYEPYFMRETLKIVFSDPLFYAKIKILRTIPFLVDSSLSRSGSAITFYVPNRPNWIFYPYLYWGGRAVWAAYFLVMAAAAALNWRGIRERIWIWIFFITVILYFGALSSMNWDAPRMRLPVNPLIFMLFGESVFLIIKRFVAKK